MEMPHTDFKETLALLEFYAEQGIELCINEVPTDFHALSRLPPPEKPARAPIKSIMQAQERRQEEARNTFFKNFVPPPPAPQEAFQEAQEQAQAADSLAQLQVYLRQFNGSPLKNTAKNFIFADGNPAAPVMFIAETPKSEDEREARAYAGASGLLMDNMLRAIGLSRESAYLTYLIPYRPPGDRAPTAQECACFLPFLERHITLINPRYLFLLGSTPAAQLLKTKESLVRLRGKWHMYQTIKTLTSFHPDVLRKQPQQKRLAYEDLLLLKAALQNDAQAGV